MVPTLHSILCTMYWDFTPHVSRKLDAYRSITFSLEGVCKCMAWLPLLHVRTSLQPVYDMSISPDGGVLATSSEDGHLKFWQINWDNVVPETWDSSLLYLSTTCCFSFSSLCVCVCAVSMISVLMEERQSHDSSSATTTQLETNCQWKNLSLLHQLCPLSPSSLPPSLPLSL